MIRGPKHIEEIPWVSREIAPVATDQELLALVRDRLSPKQREAVLIAVAACRETYDRFLAWSAAVPGCDVKGIEKEMLALHQL